MSVDLADFALPSHVSPDRVIDYDFISDARFHGREPHEVMAWLANETPGVFWTPRNGGHWVLCRHKPLFAAARDPELFSSHSATLPAMQQEPNLIPLKFGGELHAAYRSPLLKAFSPANSKALEQKIVDLIGRLIDDVIADGRCDFITAVAEILPVVVFMELMGIPTERLREFRTWVVLSATSKSEEERTVNYGRILGVMDDLVRQRQARREDDLISTLLDSEIMGRPITFEEMQGYCTMLFLAGLDTVSNSMAFGICHLARDPVLQERLSADPGLTSNITEEILRRYSVANVVRVVTRDAEFQGVSLKPDDRVLFVLPAGNLDNEESPDATSTDIDRKIKTHIAFNSGPHRCVGSHLARVELNVLYREWSRRIPSFALDPARAPVYRAGFTLAVDSLPLVWDRGLAR